MKISEAKVRELDLGGIADFAITWYILSNINAPVYVWLLIIFTVIRLKIKLNFKLK